IPGIPAAAGAEARLIACAAVVSGVGDMRARTLIAIGLAWIAVVAAPMRTARAQEWALDQLPSGSTLTKATAEPTEDNGSKPLKVGVTEAATRGQPGIDLRDMPTFVLIPTTFKNGTIKVDVLGRLNGKGPPDARAFIGLAYRVMSSGERFESVYLRPLNGRKANPPPPRDKRAIQYYAYPDWKFDRLRKEYPDGRFESGADINADEWISLKIDIDDARLRVGINAAEELVLADAKVAPQAGSIGLWVDIGTAGYFANLRVRPAEE